MSDFDAKLKAADEAIERLRQEGAEYARLREEARKAQAEVERLERERDAARAKWDRIAVAFILGLATRWWNRVKQNRASASKPRSKRGISPENKLRMHGLRCVLRDEPDISAEGLLERLDADGRLTYDNDDVELRFADDVLVIRDLKTGAEPKTATINSRLAPQISGRRA